ncbi:hypothetical protein [Nocardioides jejuensis]|uniref:Spheroidene monooxygenase n=1 Tax=Nocardioides jejuensis TaxID=2502782 RepID=A0A4R1CER4_9ACTN|nr:hypothetical protein [Nocardioides jejuensis]TCJ28558.1 hypothetical protein EPD65_07555 [Nocardioides jejuensis]
MPFHSFHLAELPAGVAARAWLRPPTPERVPGLRHAEWLAGMRLGAPVVSLDRLQVRRVAVFAEWEDEAALEAFLADDPIGRALATGWHVRLEFLRRWGHVAAYDGLPDRAGEWDAEEPVVAVTLARMRLGEVPRFLSWGKPVERQVRDDPATTLSLAAFRPPRTIATFSIWRTVRVMEAMVLGRAGDRRHVDAMRERARRDFHHEFATYRFRPLSEHGSWQGRTAIVPRLGV